MDERRLQIAWGCFNSCKAAVWACSWSGLAALFPALVAAVPAEAGAGAGAAVPAAGQAALLSWHGSRSEARLLARMGLAPTTCHSRSSSRAAARLVPRLAARAPRQAMPSVERVMCSPLMPGSTRPL
ncbi:nitrate reductase subunit beta [Micractinium conductrix]|uniref:Nitrate reductase subunit beta n=1 Tax=Micractinium conductrix TaxID=554055 RepID=A0A2P6V927_9CHLO|nr:nitrate reductase subunit beta [Micractinium conductrix]|eukprot:PSC70575.1 nitrate reductase subunit beta [Micractinium conductrix]